MIKTIKYLLVGFLLLSSTLAFADRDGHGHGWRHRDFDYEQRGGYGFGHGHHHHGHHGHHENYGPVFFAPPAPRPIIREQIVYYQQPIIQPPAPVYYQEQVIYEQPPAPVYRPAPVYYGDHRTPTGLVGGAIGSVIGYQAGRGDPLAAGIGAAAGALLGNTMR